MSATHPELVAFKLRAHELRELVITQGAPNEVLPVLLYIIASEALLAGTSKAAFMRTVQALADSLEWKR